MNQIAEQLSGLPTWMIATITVTLATLIMLVAKRLFLNRLDKLAKKSNHHITNIVIRALKRPLTIVILIINMVLLVKLLQEFEIASDRVTEMIQTIAKILMIVALLLFFDRVVVGSIQHSTRNSFVLRNSDGIIRGVSHALIFGIGLLIILATLGISVTPVIASLGITSLAVALALQPTLENFFSGIQLLFDKPFRVDDFIELESGEQGFVEKIGWRSTWIRMLANNVVVIPNSAISNSKLINYDYPRKELSVPVELGVHYNSDLQQVEDMILDVASHLLKEHEFGVESYTPLVFWHTFDNSSINCTVILRAHEYANRFVLKSEFVKAIYRRFNEEGICIPYPIRAINLEQENVEWPVSPMPKNETNETQTSDTAIKNT